MAVVYTVAQVDSLDPLFPYMQYYDLANYNVDTFIKIRYLIYT